MYFSNNKIETHLLSKEARLGFARHESCNTYILLHNHGRGHINYLFYYMYNADTLENTINEFFKCTETFSRHVKKCW